MANSGISGIKVFSATKSRERDVLGDRATEWLAAHTEVEVIEMRTVQSSDNAFHCLTIVVIYRLAAAAAEAKAA